MYIHNLTMYLAILRKNVALKCGLIKKTANVNNSPLGENSPNLVTLGLILRF
jgi:hypothetical protein